jgi:hypothetical protein
MGRLLRPSHTCAKMPSHNRAARKGRQRAIGSPTRLLVIGTGEATIRGDAPKRAWRVTKHETMSALLRCHLSHCTRLFWDCYNL